jgi:hypothetical protein
MGKRFLRRSRSISSYPTPTPLSEDQLSCLRTIEPSYALVDGASVYPVKAVLNSGETVNHAYVIGLEAAKKNWEYLFFKGPVLEATNIRTIIPSEDRIPPRFANMLYELGENHMGGLTFQLTFSDGKVANYGFGSALFRDFLEMPP